MHEITESNEWKRHTHIGLKICLIEITVADCIPCSALQDPTQVLAGHAGLPVLVAATSLTLDASTQYPEFTSQQTVLLGA